MDILKEYFKHNESLDVSTGYTFDIHKLTKNYVILKCPENKHEVKYYFDKEEYSDLLFIEYLHTLKSRGVCTKIEFTMFNDVKIKPYTTVQQITMLKAYIELAKKHGFKSVIDMPTLIQCLDLDMLDAAMIIDSVKENKLSLFDAIEKYHKRE